VNSVGGSRLKTGVGYLYRLVLTVITLSVGLIVLLSFVVDAEVLYLLRGVFVEWTIIVIAFAIILGVLNVLRVHAKRMQEQRGGIYSLVLVVAFLAVFVPGILDPDAFDRFGLSSFGQYVGPTGTVVDFIYQHVQRPLQATLFSLMAFFAATAAWRVFRIRTVASGVMFLATVLVLLGSVKLNVGINWDPIIVLKDWIMDVLATAGARGILLGITIGTIVTGIRLLAGIDRPYSD